MATEEILDQLVLRGNSDDLKYYIDQNPELAQKSISGGFGYSLLHKACTVGATNCMKILIKAGLDVNQSNIFGSTPLMKAVERGAKGTGMYDPLIKAGANVNAQDKNGNTPLMRAVALGYMEAAELLLPYGADPDMVNENGKRPLDLALQNGNARSATVLGSASMVLVPGFISPKVKDLKNSLAVIFTFFSYIADVVADIILALTLVWSGQTTYGVLVWIFTLLPSVVMACIPYQSWSERILTLLQLRMLYEILISISGDRFTVRFGAYGMLMTALEDLPQMILQAYIPAKLFYEGADLTQVVGLTLLISLLSGFINSSAVLRRMYLQQFYVKEGDPETEPTGKFILTFLYCVTSVVLRIFTIVVVLVLVGGGIVIILIVDLLIRLHFANVFQMELSVIDPFASLLIDAAYSKARYAVFSNLALSTLELGLGLLLPIGIESFVIYDKRDQVLIGIGVFWVINILTLYFIQQAFPLGRTKDENIAYLILDCFQIWKSFPRWLKYLWYEVITSPCRPKKNIEKMTKELEGEGVILEPLNVKEGTKNEDQEDKQEIEVEVRPEATNPNYVVEQIQEQKSTPEATNPNFIGEKIQEEMKSQGEEKGPEPINPNDVVGEPGAKEIESGEEEGDRQGEENSDGVGIQKEGQMNHDAVLTVGEGISVEGVAQGTPQGVPQGTPQGIPQGIPLGIPLGIPQEAQQVGELSQQQNQQQGGDHIDLSAFEQEQALRDRATEPEEQTEGKEAKGDQKTKQEDKGKKKKKQKTTFKKAPGCWNAWKQSPHGWGLVLTLAVLIWFFTEIRCLDQYGRDQTKLDLICGDLQQLYYDHYYDRTYLNNLAKYGNLTREDSTWCKFCLTVGPQTPWAWVILGFLYLVYLLHSFYCRAAKYLIGMKTLEYAYDRYLQARGCHPGIRWDVVCYHYETRTRTYTDSNGRTQTQTYQERVNTWYANMNFRFDSWTDISDHFSSDVEMSRIRFQHMYSLADDYTANCYNQEKAKFRRDNDRDQYQDFWETYQVDRINPMLVFHNIKLPWMLRYTYYVCFSLILFSWPMRVWVSSLSARSVVQMVKSIRRNQ